MATRRVLLPIVLLCAIVLAGCSKEPAADDDGEGCSIADCPPTETPSSSETASNTTTTSTASNTTTTTTAPRPVQTLDVSIQNTAFSPASLTIQKGDTVRWTQKDTNLHTVTSAAGAPETYDSGDLDPVVKPTFTHTFSTVGDHAYLCKRHGGMTGTITVVETLPA